MGGLGLVLNVAKDALLTQQYAVDETSHNIANVSTEGYTRQSPVITVQAATPYGGFLFGRGAHLNEIIRNSNDFLEKRIYESQTSLSTLTEKEMYMNVMEAIFNESSSQSLSNQFSDFWSAWNDLSNNPSGLPERNALSESGTLLAQSFGDLYDDLTKLTQEIDNAIESGVDTINQILTQIADINEKILTIEVDGNANDLLDQRNTLAKQLSGGNLQRLILARELTRNCHLLIAEQPTHGLDVGSIEYVWAFLLEQRNNSGILLVSGDLTEALSLCDRIGVMYKGGMTVFSSPFSEKIEEIGHKMTGI